MLTPAHAQMFFDVPLFFKFVSDCRAIGINCPIVPGIMVIQAYGGFKRMTAFCKSRVSKAIYAALEAVKVCCLLVCCLSFSLSFALSSGSSFALSFGSKFPL